MDLEQGNAAGIEAARAFMAEAPNAGYIDTDQLTGAWDAMCDYAVEEVLEAARTDSPPMVLQWAYQTAADFYSSRVQGGNGNIVSFDGVPVGTSSIALVLRRNRALLGRYSARGVVIAGAGEVSEA